eukprot:g19959.t1
MGGRESGNTPTGTNQMIEADGESSPETSEEETKSVDDTSPLSFTTVEEKLGKEKEMQKFLASEMFRTAVKRAMQEEIAQNKVSHFWFAEEGGNREDCGHVMECIKSNGDCVKDKANHRIHVLEPENDEHSNCK